MTQTQNAAMVLLERRQIRRSFELWCRYALAERREEPAAHHLLIINILQAIAEGTMKRVMLLMPPGSAKSTYTSVLFPPWFLNLFPQKLILACSYSYTLIEGFGRQCRDLIEKHENVLGYTLSRTAAAAGDWRISAGGGYFCAGVNAGIAGHRADLAFIDDYLGTQIEADSKVTRDRNYEWYRNDFSPRLKPDAARIIIANRRHEDDLVGRLLASEGDKWTVIRLPMLAEDNDPLGRKLGERLWPEWFTQDQVDEAKLESRTWAGLYQQRPAPEEGNYFKKDWIVGYASPSFVPKNLRMYCGSDHAFKKDTDNDRSCYIPAGLDSNGVLWVLPWFWDRVNTAEGVERMLDMSALHRPVTWFAGRENITGSIAPFLYKRMMERNIFIPIEELPENRDKEQKAQSIKARMSARMVMFPTYLPDWELALNELLTFPGGMFDDFVDALSKLGQGLGQMVKASIPAEEWDGIVPEQRLTCGWLQGSHRRRQRSLQPCDF